MLVTCSSLIQHMTAAIARITHQNAAAMRAMVRGRPRMAVHPSGVNQKILISTSNWLIAVSESKMRNQHGDEVIGGSSDLSEFLSAVFAFLRFKTSSTCPGRPRLPHMHPQSHTRRRYSDPRHPPHTDRMPGHNAPSRL